MRAGDAGLPPRGGAAAAKDDAAAAEAVNALAAVEALAQLLLAKASAQSDMELSLLDVAAAGTVDALEGAARRAALLRVAK
jgi:hypothetical protein